MPAPRTRVWLVACAAAALLLAVVTGALLRARALTAKSASTAPSAAVPATCDAPLPALARAQPDAEAPPVILWAEGSVRLFIGGRAAFSSPERPTHFAPGEHVLRAEAEGHAPVETRLLLKPFVPALIHAQVLPGMGISLLRLGAGCANCEAPLTAVQLASGPRRGDEAGALKAAADALRTDQWRAAKAALERLPPRPRDAQAYHRLRSAFWSSAGDGGRAREEAARAARAKGAEGLRPLLSRLAELERSEEARATAVVVARWNRLTEQHAALIRASTGVVDVDVNDSSHRMERLSSAFAEAAQKQDTLECERVLRAAEQTVTGLLEGLAGAGGQDCAFRTRLLHALAGESP